MNLNILHFLCFHHQKLQLLGLGQHQSHPRPNLLSEAQILFEPRGEPKNVK